MFALDLYDFHQKVFMHVFHFQFPCFSWVFLRQRERERGILRNTQNEEIMPDHIGFGGTPTSCLLGLPQHIQVYRLYQIFSLNEN